MMHTFNASLFVSTGYGLQHISFSHGQTVRSGRSHIYTAGTFDEPFRVGTYRVSVKNKDDIDVKNPVSTFQVIPGCLYTLGV